MRTFFRLHLVAYGILLGLLCSRVSAQIVSTNPNTANAGQSVNMVITGNNTNFTAVTGFMLRHQTQLGTIYWGTGFVANTPTNASTTFNIPPNAPLGNYRLEAFGIPAFNNALNVGVGQGSNYGWVSGRVIDERNGNCTVTGGTDVPVVGGVVQLSPGQFLTTDADGNFGGWVPLGNYTASYQPVGCNTWVCPAGGTHPVSILTSLSTDANNDFHFNSVANCSDLSSTMSLAFMRPGFTVHSSVVFRNNGPYDYSGAVSTVTRPSQLTFVSASIPPTSVVGNTLTWNLGTMAPNGQVSIIFTDSVSATVGLSVPLTFVSDLPSVGIDPNPNNNSTVRTVLTQGSSDPNDKQVWDQLGNPADGPVDPSTSLLKYLIRFQNTGTDTAFNIFIRDTLDAALNPATLRVRGASHAYQFSMSGTGNVQFTFPNILLVDSFQNEPLSHGWIEYEIAPDAGLPVPTTIANDASIYFDFNAPVVTNTTHTTLCPVVTPSYSFTGAGFSFNFTNTSSGGTTYSWDFGDGGSSTSQNPSHTYATVGNYVVCLTVSNACRSESYCDTVSVCTVPTAAFTSSVSGNTATFTDGSHASTNGWAWDFGDGNTATSQNPIHTYAGPGTYNVCLTTTNGCDMDSTCEPLSILVGITNDQGFHVLVSPNPGRDWFMVEVTTEELGPIQLRLMDLAGRCVKMDAIPDEGGVRKLGLDLSGQAPGMYLLQVRGESGASKVLRLIKE